MHVSLMSLAWTLIAAWATVVTILYCFASALLRAMALHDLKVETVRLRAEYARRLEEMRRGKVETVELLGGPPPMAMPDAPASQAA